MTTDRMITMAALLDRHPELRPTPDERRSAGLGSTPLSTALRQGVYVPPRARSIGQRAANILLWAARLYPGQYIAYGDLVAALLGTTRTITTRAVVQAVTRIALAGAYSSLPKRGPHFVMSVRGVGVRCTTDKADATANYLPRLQMIMARAVRRYLQYLEMIDPAKPDSFDAHESNIRGIEMMIAKVEETGVRIPNERKRVVMLMQRLAEARRLRELE
jgi:hypothetical protein